MKILIAYFSATGNTPKMAGAIGEAFAAKGCDVTLSDITPYADRRKTRSLAAERNFIGRIERELPDAGAVRELFADIEKMWARLRENRV